MQIPYLALRASYMELRVELDAAVLGVLDAGTYILGEEVETFEREYAEYIGVKHCIGVANGLEALVLALQARGIGAGDEVLVPSNTYIATWLAVSAVGAGPVPVEPEEDTMNMDPGLMEAAITSRTRAVIPVHLYGLPARMDLIGEIAARHGLFVLEDAAQSHGASIGGRRTGAWGHAAAHSFYPTKNLGAFGDAGAVTTDDDDLAARLRLLRNYGSPRKYMHDVKGGNSRLDPVQAAVLRVKLKVLDEWNERRSRLAALYLEALRDCPGLRLPVASEGMTHVWHIFAVRHEQRDALQATLAGAGIGTLIHYPVPPHLSGAYREDGIPGDTCRRAGDIAASVLSLPLHPQLREADARRVVEAVQSYCKLRES